MESGDEGIGCPLHAVGVITSHLWPAYEDLFDEAEEHALQMLLGQWVGLCNNEDFIFQKVGHLGFFLLKSFPLPPILPPVNTHMHSHPNTHTHTHTTHP